LLFGETVSILYAIFKMGLIGRLQIKRATSLVDIRHTNIYNSYMSEFDWDDDKNIYLEINRGVSFEDAIFHIMKGDILDLKKHPNKEKCGFHGKMATNSTACCPPIPQHVAQPFHSMLTTNSTAC